MTRTRTRLRPFRESHADIFDCKPFFKNQFVANIPLLTELGVMDMAGSHILDGRILFVGGWCEPALGVAEMFLYPSVYVDRYPKVFYRDAKWWVDDLLTKYHRVQCWGEDSELSRRWLTALGFECEGVLKHFLPDGSAMLVWAKTR